MCKREIYTWIFFGNKSNKEDDENESKPVCFKCLKRLMDSDGKNIGLRNKIEDWLTEKKYSFTHVNEPADFFHFTLREVGPFKIIIDIFQKKESSHLIVGFMFFLSKKLSNTVSRFSPKQKESLKRKVDEFLSTIRADPRLGYRVGYEIISENGNYGAKYFVKSNINDCTKEKFFKILEIVESTSVKSGEFLNKEMISSFS